MGQSSTIAPLRNVALCTKAMEIITTADERLPRMICFYGRTGTGKSVAAGYTANKYDAFYVECRSVWTKKSLLEGIARAMGILPERTMAAMVEQICGALVAADKPLIIDEMDYIVDRRAVEIIRDLYEGSGAPILLIGEEQLPAKLAQWRQFNGRIMDYIETQRGTPEDARVLSRFYCRRGVVIADDLLADMTAAADGLIRLMCVNLARIEEETLTMGRSEVDLAAWKKWGKGYLTGSLRLIKERGR